MYEFEEIKDLRVLKIMQKAKELNDKDLQNKALIVTLLKANLSPLSANEKETLTRFLNDLIEAKKKAGLSS